MENKILVCIPSYNAERTIKTTIESVLDQTASNFKILVVDNCSNDKTLEVVEKLQKKYGNSNKIEIVINRSNIGRIQNWNKCVELFLESDCSHLKFLFTGDVLKKNGLGLLLNGFEKYDNKIGIVVGGYNYIEDGVIKKSKNFSQEKHLTPKEGLEFFIKEGNWVGPPLSCMFSKESLYDTRFDTSFDFASDYIFYVNVVNNFGGLCIDKTVGDFFAMHRLHLQKYRTSLIAKLEELHTRYFALSKLKGYISEGEGGKLTKYLNRESVKTLILHVSLVDSLSVFIHKVKMSIFSFLFRF